MEINYVIVVPVILLAILFVVWIIRRNRKDEKKFEKEMNESEILPEKHDKDHI